METFSVPSSPRRFTHPAAAFFFCMVAITGCAVTPPNRVDPPVLAPVPVVAEAVGVGGVESDLTAATGAFLSIGQAVDAVSVKAIATQGAAVVNDAKQRVADVTASMSAEQKQYASTVSALNQKYDDKAKTDAAAIEKANEATKAAQDNGRLPLTRMLYALVGLGLLVGVAGFVAYLWAHFQFLEYIAIGGMILCGGAIGISVFVTVLASVTPVIVWCLSGLIVLSSVIVSGVVIYELWVNRSTLTQVVTTASTKYTATATAVVASILKASPVPTPPPSAA